MEETVQNPERAQNSSNDAIFARFKNERDEWTVRIQSMSARMKDIYEISELQIDIYSYRQIAVDYTHTLMTHLTKINRIFRERKIERWEHYTRNYDLRMDKDPKELHIYVDIADVVERKDFIQTHLEFFRETIRTIDSMSYGIKHRLALEEYKRV
jgi:hypothetical protein